MNIKFHHNKPESGKQSPLIVSLVIGLASALILFSAGCEYYPKDSKAYPIQYEELAHGLNAYVQPPKLIFLGDTLGYKVVDYQEPQESYQFYASISDPFNRHVFDQMSIRRSELFGATGEISFHNSDVLDGDNDGIEESYFFLKTRNKLKFYQNDLLDREITLLDSISLPDSLADYPFDSLVRILPWLPAPGMADTVKVFSRDHFSGYVPLPRDYKIYSGSFENTPLCSFQFSNPLARNRYYLDLDGDSELEFLLSTYQTCNGRKVDGFTDNNGYVICVNSDGSFRWVLDTGTHGGMVEIAFQPGIPDTLYVLDCQDTFGDGEEKSVFYKLNPEDGTVYDQRSMPGRCSIIVTNDSYSTSFVATEYDGIETIVTLFDYNFTPLKRTRVPKPLIFLRNYNLEEPFGLLLYLTESQSGTLLMDADLRVVAYSPVRLHSKKMSYVSKSGQYIFMGYRGDGRYTTYRLLRVPWYRWWTWRWRYLLLAALVVPAAGFGIFMLVRYELARRKHTRELIDAYTRLNSSHAELQELHSQLNALIARQYNTQEEFRRKMARDLHDNMGGHWSAVKHMVEAIILQLKSQDSGLKTGLMNLIYTVEEGADKTRQVSYDLLPPLIDELGLVPALDDYLKRYEKVYGIEIERAIDLQLPRNNRELETSLFRIVQEALTNVQKYAGVNEVQVNVFEYENSLHVQVIDEGRGFDQETNRHKSSLGLFNMQQRVLPYHGKVKINSALGEGTTIEVVIPNMEQWRLKRDTCDDS